MRRFRHLLIVLMVAAVAPGAAGVAQQADRTFRLGIVGSTYGPEDAAFEESLRALGWVEGPNFAMEYCWPQGRDEVQAAATDLVRRGVDAIVVGSSFYAEPARRATSTTPIVFCTHGDPVGTGHVATLVHPGGNLTGVSSLLTELGAKSLEILTQAIPGARRIGVLWDPTHVSHPLAVSAIEAAGGKLGIELRSAPAASVDEFDAAFAGMVRDRVDAVLVVVSPLSFNNCVRLAELALEHRLPSISAFRESAPAGDLLSYGPDILEMFRRCAGYVDRILKGASPAELPVEQAPKYVLVINLKTAKSLGLSIPSEVLARADEVIE